MNFHGFRRQFVTWIENTDLSLRAKMELSRHSTPTLLVRYSHTRMSDKRPALASLPVTIKPAHGMASTGRNAGGDF